MYVRNILKRRNVCQQLYEIKFVDEQLESKSKKIWNRRVLLRGSNTHCSWQLCWLVARRVRGSNTHCS